MSDPDLVKSWFRRGQPEPELNLQLGWVADQAGQSRPCWQQEMRTDPTYELVPYKSIRLTI